MLDDIVAEAAADSGVRIHAYCWMTNHLHALVQASDQPLSAVMQQVAWRYSRHRHRQLDTSGHLFERRYGARLVADDPYFLTALRYIHLNPCKANLVARPAEYPWSSHAVYLGQRRAAWVSTDFALSLFNPNQAAARDAYQRFIDAPIDDSEPEQALSPAWPAKRARLPKRAKDASPCLSALDSIAAEVCREHLIDPTLLCSPGRSRCLVQARVAFTQRVLGTRACTLRQAAAYLGCSPAAISQALARYRL